MTHVRRGWRGVLLVSLMVALLTGGSAAGAAVSAEPATQGRQTLTGTIDGARYRVALPHRWNGTLVLYSHGYFPVQFPRFGIDLTNRPADRSETEAWLLDHGYALAGSEFQDMGLGYTVEAALRDQIALLDWFEAHVGRPRHTVATGQSLGGAIAALLAERHPRRFDGVMTVCAGFDPNGTFNAALDITFAVKTLLAPGQDIDLVHPRNAAASVDLLVRAVDEATRSEQGRARLALIASLNNVTGWFSAHNPRPTERAERIRQQAQWIKGAYIGSFGPIGRVDLERHAGGNPSTNVGIDYGRQLARSSQTDLVRQAYAAAPGADLRADLATLAAAPRIVPDPAALAYMHRFGVPLGTARVPTLTVHTVGDGGAVPDQERWYASQVRRSGNASRLRQLYVDRGMHCAISAAEEITALRGVFHHIGTGRWPDTNPRRMDEAARALGDRYQLVLDFGTFEDKPRPPAFTTFTPPVFLRPSR